MRPDATLLHGDCLELMKSLPDRSVDMILCDLPYGTTSCPWDEVIPFDRLWEQYRRIRTPTCPIVLFASQPFTTRLIASNMSEFRENLIWLKNKAGSGFLAGKRHTKIHEDVVVFSESGNYTFNPQKWLIEDKAFITQRRTFDAVVVGSNIYTPMERTRKVDSGERNPLSVISCRVPFTPQKSKSYSDEVDLRYHPTQKPLRLCQYLIESYSDPGAVVLDNCMGSGTSGVAALELGRKFIGMESNENYFQIAEKRICAEHNN